MLTDRRSDGQTNRQKIGRLYCTLLQAGAIITKEDNPKSKKDRVVIFVRDMSSSPVLHFYQVPSKGFPVTERTRTLFQTKQWEINKKVRKPELSFLYVTHCLVQFFISTKYHKNIPKGN